MSEIQKEFNLSERIMITDKIKEIKTFPNMGVIFIEDVKEFIRLLKEELIVHEGNWRACPQCCRSWAKQIDKLAGEKLCQ